MTLFVRHFAAVAALASALLACAWGSVAFADEATSEVEQTAEATSIAEPSAPLATEVIAVAEEPDTDVEWAGNTWMRLYGDTALDTMTRISSHGWKTSDVVVVASAEGYWDALAASSLAGKYQAPVLFTSPSELSAQTKDEISRLHASHAFVIGGTAAVSDKIDSQIKPLLNGDKQVTRVWGSNAPNTAVVVADELGDALSDTCIIATSNGYWDALSASPYAYATGSPVYLTDPSGAISELVLAAIEREQFKHALIVGGPAAVSAKTEEVLAAININDVVRFAGENAYHTSKLFANWELSHGMGANRMGVATASGHWDALSGSALCGKNKAVLVLADDANTLTTSVAQANKTQISRGYVFGGPAAVGNKAFEAFSRAA